MTGPFTAGSPRPPDGVDRGSCVKRSVQILCQLAMTLVSRYKVSTRKHPGATLAGRALPQGHNVGRPLTSTS